MPSETTDQPPAHTKSSSLPSGDLTCPQCNSRFSKPEHLHRHVLSSHQPAAANGKSNICLDCGKGFTRRDVLLRHSQSCPVASRRISEDGQLKDERKPSTVQEPAQSLPSPIADSSGRVPQERSKSDQNRRSTAVTALGKHHGSGNSKARPENEVATCQTHGETMSSVNCQKRKVKCTGEEVCRQCRTADLRCAYTSNKKKRRLVERAISGREADAPNVSESLRDMMGRIADLENNCSSLRQQLHLSSQKRQRSLSSASSCDSERNSVTEACEDLEIPADDSFRGPTSLLKPISVLNHTVAGSDGSPSKSSSRTDELGPQPALNWREISRDDARVMDRAEKETRLDDEVRLNAVTATFFSQINPYYPCLNENEFRGQIGALTRSAAATSKIPMMTRPDRYQLVALVNLMEAEVRLLSDDWAHEEAIPGWTNFWRAERILGRLIWQGNGNRLTMQCLIVKARYFLHLEHRSAAHETITRVVRLIFQLGYHDSSSWEAWSPFERVMRQRIFWTVFFLERSFSLNCGYPYLIREADIKVDLPIACDDHELFPDQPLPDQPAEMQSYGPSLIVAVKWARLSAEIWDSMSAVNRAQPATAEFVVSMDARIVYIMNNLPCCFHQSELSGAGDDKAPYIWYQGVLMRLRFQQLRLLLRQEVLLSLDYDDTMASECQAIISSSLQILQCRPGLGDVPVGRFAVVFYILVTLVPLVCLINGRRSTQNRTEAVTCFPEELAMLQSLASSVGMARHILSNLKDLINSTKEVIQRFPPACDLAQIYPYSGAMEPSAPAPPNTLPNPEDGNFMDTLFANPSLLDLSLPPVEGDGVWVTDSFTQWMHMADGWG
ncbi:hypothetical protein FE257_011350 [Aspergillus nanangensis]|uniref:C2H2-type domain-containing protein n=1 Tax=Aspergillus nanangensis TaxID=2582783 RepID=A0AAD4CIW8_ASPNN|nr:hypothetical protein FE257_011350 [Aspergillus nanangensis]